MNMKKYLQELDMKKFVQELHPALREQMGAFIVRWLDEHPLPALPCGGDDELEGTMSDELKPCPFCGEVPDVNNPATFHREVGDRWARVVCCIEGPEIRSGFYTPLEEWKDEAIAAWNERPIEDALRARIAELEKKLQDLQLDYWDATE